MDREQRNAELKHVLEKHPMLALMHKERTHQPLINKGFCREKGIFMPEFLVLPVNKTPKS